VNWAIIKHKHRRGDMTKKSEQEDEFVFQGTLMEGPKIDLIELSGIQLTEEEEEKLWGEWNERNLLMETGVVAEIELYEVDEIPGQSDVWYEYRC